MTGLDELRDRKRYGLSPLSRVVVALCLYHEIARGDEVRHSGREDAALLQDVNRIPDLFIGCL